MLAQYISRIVDTFDEEELQNAACNGFTDAMVAQSLVALVQLGVG